MATRTRQEYLKDLANNYSSTTMVDTGQKFCKLFSLSELRHPILILSLNHSNLIVVLLQRAIHDLCVSYSYAVVQQQEENHRSTEAVLRRFATRSDMLAGDTRRQQSEHGLLFRNKHRYDRLDRRTF